MDSILRLTVLSLMIASVLSASSENQVCNKGKVYTMLCGNHCPRTCENYQLPQTSNCLSRNKQCISGCFCPAGSVENKDGYCIDPDECTMADMSIDMSGKNKTSFLDATEKPSDKMTAVKPVSKCTNGMQYSKCGTACPLTCDNYNKTQHSFCTMNCVMGCYCPPGTVQHNNFCINPTNCPNMAKVDQPTCDNGKEFRMIGPSCPDTCDNRHLELPCKRNYTSGCFCPSGTVLHDGACIRSTQCPQRACSGDLVYKGCGNVCPMTCENHMYDVVCFKPCRAGCFCPDGKVLLGNNTCVDAYSCPDEQARRMCPQSQNMIYKECGPICPTTCETLTQNGHSSSSSSQCAVTGCGPPGCYCADNLVMKWGQCLPAGLICQDETLLREHSFQNINTLFIKMKISNLERSDFINRQEFFQLAVSNVIHAGGFGNVLTNVTSVDQHEHLVVTVKLLGSSLPKEPTQIVTLLQSQASSLNIDVIHVYVEDGPASEMIENEGLPQEAVIGVAVGGGVVCLILLILLLIVTILCTRTRRSSRSTRKKHHVDVTTTGSKGKLVQESLS